MPKQSGLLESQACDEDISASQHLLGNGLLLLGHERDSMKCSVSNRATIGFKGLALGG